MVNSSCEYIYKHNSMYVTMSDSNVVDKNGATNGHHMGNIGHHCHGSYALDSVDFFRNWGQALQAAGLVNLHGLNNPDSKGFYFRHTVSEI